MPLPVPGGSYCFDFVDHSGITDAGEVSLYHASVLVLPGNCPGKPESSVGGHCECFDVFSVRVSDPKPMEKKGTPGCGYCPAVFIGY